MQLNNSWISILKFKLIYNCSCNVLGFISDDHATKLTATRKLLLIESQDGPNNYRF